MKIAAALLLLLCLCPCAQAGLVFEETTTHPGRDEAPLTMRASFEHGRLRIQFTDARASPIILRDGALYMLNAADRTYNVLDQAAMAQLAANDATARKGIDEKMEKLTPAQRAMMQPVLDIQAQKLAAERQALDLRRTVRRETIGGRPCVVWEDYLEGDKQAEACVAAPAVFAEGAEMLEAMALISEFLATARQSLGGAATLLYQIPSYQLRMQAAVAQQLGGVVLRWREFVREKPADTTALTAVRTEALDSTMFAVPAGYVQ